MRIHYTVPLGYSSAADQFVNDLWVHEIVTKAMELEDVTVYTILNGDHRRHYDFPLDLFVVAQEVDLEMFEIVAPDNVLKYDTDST